MGIGERITIKQEGMPETRRIVETIPPIHALSDLILPETTRAALHDFLAYRKHEGLIFGQWGLSATHKNQKQTAINFYGPPGTGKTMAAHAIANEIQQPLLMVNYAELESKYVGETSKNISKLFEDAKQSNSIIFFDEADAILSRRVTNMSHATDVSVNQTRSVLLILMNQHDGLVIFATNFIENYDPAFMRRILAHINFVLPDTVCREQLWKKYIPLNLPHTANFSDLAELSEGLSGSDISNCVLKAALSAARQESSLINSEHFKIAINEIHNSKIANNKGHGTAITKIEQRVVSEEYVIDKIGQAN